MFKPVYGLEGVIVGGISPSDTTMKVDDVSTYRIKKAIQGGDYTYLFISDSAHFEIIKVTDVIDGILTIERGQEGTTPDSFTDNSPISFVLTQSSIQEIVTQQALGEINIVGDGIVTVTKNDTNNYTVSAPVVIITSDSDQIVVGGDFPEYVLSTPVKNGCC